MNTTRHKALEYGSILLAAYTSLIVGIAEGTPIPYAITLPVVVAAWVLQGWYPHRRLGTATAFVLGVLAFALAFTELVTGTIESRLTAGAHLTVYLSWIILLMRKQLVQYLWLFALSVVMAAIGAVLLHTAGYGMALMAFLMLALWNLAAYSMIRSRERFQDDDETEASAAETSTIASSALLQPSAAAGSIQMEGNESWFSKRFVGGVFGIAFGAVCFGFVFFLLIPRYWIGSRTWGAENDDDTSGITGFSERVSLGAYGKLLQSNEVVMEVRFFDGDNNPVEVTDYAAKLNQAEPLFRGHTLDTYESGRWSSSEDRSNQSRRLRDTTPSRYEVRQEYRLRAIGSRVLFAVRPDVSRFSSRDRSLSGRALTGRRHLFWDQHDSTLLAPRKPSSRSVYRYEIFASRPSGRRVFRGVVAQRRRFLRIANDELRRQLTDFLRDDVGMQSRAIPPAAANGNPNGFVQQEQKRAEKIVRYLRDSGNYSYTLTIPQRQSRQLDPVIEFLRETKTGHCEYYATALVLLLRADGIAARLVGGFRGGEKNNLTGYFDVQQRHAHAWVEAWIGRNWVTLDATPANERAEAVDSVGGVWKSWREFKQFFRHFWSTYILEMTYSQQSRAIYTPLKATAKDAWNSLSQERKGTAAGLSALKEFLSDPSRWFSWQGGVLSFGLLWLLVSMVWGAKKIWRAVRTIREEGLLGLSAGPKIDFYERFRVICESVGVVRSPFQTQREFAYEFAGRFPELSNGQPHAFGPADLAAAFYSVRFGKKTLSPGARKSIDECLTKLESAISERGNPSP